MHALRVLFYRYDGRTFRVVFPSRSITASVLRGAGKFTCLARSSRNLSGCFVHYNVRGKTFGQFLQNPTEHGLRRLDDERLRYDCRSMPTFSPYIHIRTRAHSSHFVFRSLFRCTSIFWPRSSRAELLTPPPIDLKRSDVRASSTSWLRPDCRVTLLRNILALEQCRRNDRRESMTLWRARNAFGVDGGITRIFCRPSGQKYTRVEEDGQRIIWITARKRR